VTRKPIADVVPGQTGAFFEPAAEEVEAPPDKPSPKRETSQRAGTVIDHRWMHPIMATANRRKQHGLYDESQRLYQTGGELEKFVFWKLKVVSIAFDAWMQISDKADWIEVIDNRRNECWRIPMNRAKKHLVQYDAGGGKRVGIAIKHWDIQTARGTYVHRGEA
jgi:hypothetical protein